MKKYLSLLPFLFLHFCGCPGLAQTYAEKQELPGALNFLKNPGFENGLVGWTRGTGCSTNSPVPLSGSRNGNCTGSGAGGTLWEQVQTFPEYRPYIGQTWKASCNIVTSAPGLQFCGIFNGAETSCVPVDESASVNASGYKEYAVSLQIPPDQSTSFTAGLKVKTGSSSQTMRVDNCYLGPWKGVVGLALNATKGEPVTLTGSWTTNTTYSASKRRVADRLEIDFKIDLAGPPNNAQLTINIPDSLTIDVNKLASSSTRVDIGRAFLFDSDTGANRRYGVIERNSTTSVVIMASSSSLVAQTSPFTWASGDSIYGTISVPIVGWDASTVTNVVGLVPKETVYSANSSSGGTISRENVDFINGNCTVSSTSIYTCPLVSGVFSQIPKCTVTSVHASGRLGSIISQSTSQIVVRTFDDSGTNVAMDWNIICQLSGTDYESARKTYDNVPFSPMESGSYTPTLTNTTNISSSTANLFTYVRVGDVVMVHGRPSVQPTAASGTVSELRISLPIEPAANFSSTGRCFGVGGLFRNAAQSPHTGVVNSVNGAKLCSYVFNAQTTVDTSNGLSFSYLLK